MDELEELARRAVDTITLIAGKVAGFATRVLIGTTVVCVSGFLLGVAALSGGIESVWIVLGIVFGSIAIGGMLLARWRIGAVRRHVPELAGEVRRLVEDGRTGTRTVVETFVVHDDAGDGTTGGSAIMLSRQMSDFSTLAGSQMEGSTQLRSAVRALTTFPLWVLTAAAISSVFAFLGFIFLIALAIG